VIGAWAFGDSLELAGLVLGAFYWSRLVKASQAMRNSFHLPQSQQVNPDLIEMESSQVKQY